MVGHYFADAYQPFHAIQLRRQLTGQNGIHFRFEEDLFLRYGKQLNIRPGPLKTIANPRDFIFDCVLEGSQLVPAILDADREAIGNRDVYDDRYFDAFFAKSRPILERRISDSITAIASMITSAWEQAGKPALPANPPPGPPRRRATAAPVSQRPKPTDGRTYSVGPARHELYCEIPATSAERRHVEPPGRFTGLLNSRRLARSAEHQSECRGGPGTRSWTQRMKDWALC